MNEHQNIRTIWQVASLIEDGATSEQIEVDLRLSIQEVQDIREHLATPEDAPGQPGTRTTPKEGVDQEYIRLRTRWAAELDIHPQDYSPLDGRKKVSGTGWYLCCLECTNCDCDGSGCSCGCQRCIDPDC